VSREMGTFQSWLQNVALSDDWTEKMKAQVDVWEKDSAQSSQSFAQNLDEKIKEAEMKLDKLVNAFLDGSIEKETYLVKKDEFIKTKTDLNKRKSDFGRKGNNWIEPLRNWINTAHHAEKLALSNDFYEIKSLAEKIGTNRRLLSRKTEFEFVRPYDLIPKYLPAVAEKAQEGRTFCEARPAPASPCGMNSGGASEQQNNPDFEKSLSWSGRWDLNPGYPSSRTSFATGQVRPFTLK